ncbi:MAG: hypothetical protein ACI9G1_003502 [Pirellulaceae bacterium]|jgi:hypothetical protein
MAQNHHIVLDQRGQFIQAEGHSQLPYLLGEVSLLPIVVLPAGAQQQWEANSVFVIKQGSEFPRRVGGPFANRTANELKGELLTQYRRDADHGDAIQIDFTTLARAGDPTRYSSEGSGVVYFDWKRGLPLKTRQVSNYKDDDVVRRIEIQCRLLSTSEMIEQDAAHESMRKMHAERQRKTLSTEQLQEIAVAIHSDNAIQVVGALQQLDNVNASELQNVIAAGLAKVAQNHPEQKEQASVLLARWATAEQTPALVALLNENVKPWEVMSGLKRLKDPRATEALMKKMSRGINRRHAISALIAIGPEVETPLLPIVTTNDFWAQRSALEVLEAIGGETSLKALRVLFDSAERQQRNQIRRSIEKIERRINKK